MKCICVCVCVCVAWFWNGGMIPLYRLWAILSKSKSVYKPLKFKPFKCFFEAKDTKPEVLLGFENFQVVAHWNLECQFLRIFHFSKFSRYHKKFQVFFCNWILFFKTHFSLSAPHWHMPITKHYHFGKRQFCMATRYFCFHPLIFWLEYLFAVWKYWRTIIPKS